MRNGPAVGRVFFAITLFPLAAAGFGGAEENANAATAPLTSRNDEFVKKLLETMRAAPYDRKSYAPAARAIVWKDLEDALAQTQDAGLKIRRAAYLELWRDLIQMHDYSLCCSMMYVFESFSVGYFSGRAISGRATGLKARLRPEEPLVFQCRHLLAEELPVWARSLRAVAASVLAGKGEEDGRRILLEILAESDRFAHPVLRAACKPEGLSLFREGLKHPKESVRLRLVSDLRLIQTAEAEKLLAQALQDTSPLVRRRALETLYPDELQPRYGARLFVPRGRIAEAAPVIREQLEILLKGQADQIAVAARYCRYLEEWHEPDVPWDKVEAFLKTSNRKNMAHALRAAAQCLAAGREPVALELLRRELRGPDRHLARQGLLIAGHADGLEAFHELLKQAGGPPPTVYDLCAAAFFMRRKGTTAEQRLELLALVRDWHARWKERKVHSAGGKVVPMEPYKAWECRQGLAEMGALCRVEGAGGQLKTVEWIEAEYEPALLSVWQEIFRVRLVSLQASADQEKIRLSKTFLQDFAQAEMEKMRKVAVPANQSDRIQEEVEEAREVMAELDFRP